SKTDSTTGKMAEQDERTYDEMERDVLALNSQIERNERLNIMQTRLAQNTTKPLYNKPSQRSMLCDETTNSFWNFIRRRGISNDLSEKINSSGGYLVPEEFADELVQHLCEHNVFREIAKSVSTESSSLKIPVADTGGAVNWIGEATPIPDTDLTFSQVVLKPYKLGGLLKASSELLEDSAFPLEQYIAERFAQLIGAEEERTFCVGDGVDKPTGLFTTKGGAEIGTTTANSAISFDNVIDLMHSVKKSYRGKSVFVTNDSTIRELRKIKDGNGQYIWQPAVKDGTPDLLVGKPIYTSPFVPEIASGALVMAFGDFNYFWIADRREMRFQMMREKYMETDQVGFHVTQRVDGKLVLPAAVKLMRIG
ncbi:MAG: phage major capsid protein, partial [Oscillospiraceae bacterium]|nr:phage major capsid protein [Oscillospiraceae bacterium]